MKKRNWIIGLCLALLLCFVMPFQVSAVGDDKELKTVKVGYVIYDGYQEGAKEEPKSGYGYEYLQQIAYYAGWKYEYINGTFYELTEKLKNGEIDIMGDLSYTKERAQYIDFSSEEQGHEYYYLFVGENRNDISSTDYSTLNHMKVGINKGSVQVDLFKEWCRDHHVDCEVVLYEDSLKRYEDINNGKLDAIVSTNISANSIVNSQLRSIVKIGSTPYYFGVNKKRPYLLKELNEAISKILQSDWYYNERVYLKYYGDTSISLTGLSQDEINWLKDKQIIKIGYMNNTLPYSSKNKDNQLVGLLQSFIDHIHTRYNIEVESVAYDHYESMLEALNNGTIDTMFPVYGNYWMAEENNMMITEPLTESSLLMVYKGEYDSSKDMVIAVSDKSALQQFYVKVHYPNAHIVKCSSVKECIQAVQSNQASCTLLSSDIYYAYRNGFDKAANLNISDTGFEAPISFAVKKENIMMYDFMKKAVSSMDENLVNEALISGGYSHPEMTVRQFLQKNIEIVIGVLGAIILLIISFFIYYVVSRKNQIRLLNSNKELGEKAYIDFATGLPNKNKCEEMISSSQPILKSTAVFMLDLNDLKVVNDTLGHEMGDMLIFNFSQLLRESVPAKYFVGRYGGDEFIIIAEGIKDKNEVNALVNKINQTMMKFNESHDQFQLRYACGYAYSKDYRSCHIKHLLDIADQNMYINKEKMKKK